MVSEINNAKCAQHMLDGMENVDFPNVRNMKFFPEWISIEHKLPENHEDVLITDGKTVYIGHLGNDRKSWFTDLEWPHHKNMGCWSVTHWMPLPQLPAFYMEQNNEKNVPTTNLVEIGS